MGGFIAQALEHVSVSTWKVPKVARLKFVRFGLACWIDHGRAYASSRDESPLGRGRVPVKFAHHSGLELHRHACDSFRDRQLLDRRFLPETVSQNFPLGFLQF